MQQPYCSWGMSQTSLKNKIGTCEIKHRKLAQGHQICMCDTTKGRKQIRCGHRQPSRDQSFCFRALLLWSSIIHESFHQPDEVSSAPNNIKTLISPLWYLSVPHAQTAIEEGDLKEHLHWNHAPDSFLLQDLAPLQDPRHTIGHLILWWPT